MQKIALMFPKRAAKSFIFCNFAAIRTQQSKQFLIEDEEHQS